jgi:hypothetical protein
MKCTCVIDGQGGGIGAAIIKGLRARWGESMEIWAIGTNAVATSQMLRAGANRGATGENSVVRSVAVADLVVGPISITWPNAMMGEVTPRMADAIISTPAPKILLPLHQEKISLVGAIREPLPHLVEEIVNRHVKEVLKDV